jgi:hypothetical protein
MAVALLGRNDEAFALLSSPRMDAVLLVNGSGFLFQPATAGLRTDIRFWSVAADLGLAEYWIQTDKWPDMCQQELTVAECKDRAASAMQARR